MGCGKCIHQEPRNLELRKLILEAKFHFSRKFIPPKITHYTVCAKPWRIIVACMCVDTYAKSLPHLIIRQRVFQTSTVMHTTLITMCLKNVTTIIAQITIIFLLYDVRFACLSVNWCHLNICSYTQVEQPLEIPTLPYIRRLTWAFWVAT